MRHSCNVVCARNEITTAKYNSLSDQCLYKDSFAAKGKLRWR